MILNQEKYLKLLEKKVQAVQFIVSTKNQHILEKVSTEINFDLLMKAPETPEEEAIYKAKYEDLEKHIEKNGYDYNPPIIFEECKNILVVTEEELKSCFDE